MFAVTWHMCAVTRRMRAVRQLTDAVTPIAARRSPLPHDQPLIYESTNLLLHDYGCRAGTFGSADTFRNTLVAMAMIELTSLRLAGMIIELPLLASWPNCLMYSSASRSCMAS